MNSHQRRKARRQDARDYLGKASAEQFLGIATFYDKDGNVITSGKMYSVPVPTGPTIADLQRDGHLLETNQEDT